MLTNLLLHDPNKTVGPHRSKLPLYQIDMHRKMISECKTMDLGMKAGLTPSFVLQLQLKLVFLRTT